ncbi:MAG: hypothetical protein U0Q16_01660 [Bryobacteraceae bacterium]
MLRYVGAMLAAAVGVTAQDRLTATSLYASLINPLTTAEFSGVHYSDDPHSPTVVFPQGDNGPGRPHPAIVSLLRLGRSSVPLLIDCLSDVRWTPSVGQKNRRP